MRFRPLYLFVKLDEPTDGIQKNQEKNLTTRQPDSGYSHQRDVQTHAIIQRSGISERRTAR